MNTPRLDYYPFLNRELEYLNQIEGDIAQYSLGAPLLELVKLRVSQINGCSFCVHYHTQRLRRMDETNARIDMVSVWQEAPCYSPRELAALRWGEAVTRLADAGGIDDELYTATVNEFGEEGTSQLTLAVAMINTWNRLAVSFHTDHKYIDALLKMN